MHESERIVTIAVIGLGGMGSAALYHVTRRGASAIGIEQFGPANTKGSSHGRSRIIRQAYYEDDRYVPLLQRAYELWDELDRDAVESLWTLCGGVAIGDPQADLIAGNLRAARRYNISHEVLTPDESLRRFPELRVRENEIAVYEPTVGALFPERCVGEHLRRAVACGAQARFGVSVTAIKRHKTLELQLSDGTTLACERLIITAGPWIAQFAQFPVRIERNVQHWFSMRPDDAPKHVFMVQRPDLPRLLYGFPDFGEGVKAAFHHSGDFLRNPGEHDDRTRPQEIEAIEAALGETFTAPLSAYVRSEPCMYTVTPDEHFIIGEMPSEANVILACGFSGHGFKFCSVIGEILADLALDGQTSADISLFDPKRFATETVRGS